MSGADDGSTTGWEGPPGDARARRWVLPTAIGAAAVVAVLVVVAVVLTSRDAAAPLAVGATAAPAGDAADRVDPDDFVPERLPPPEVTSERAGTGALLPGAPGDMTIVAADDRQLTLVDVTTGALREIRIRRSAPTSLSETVFTAGDDVVVEADTNVVRLPSGAGRPTLLAAGHRAIPTVGTPAVWVYDATTPFVPGIASLVEPDGSVRASIGLPAVAQPLVGTADGLVVAAPGVVTSVGIDGDRRLLVRGMAVATDGTRLAWLECADDMACGVHIGTVDDPDRATATLDPSVLPAGFFGLPTGTFSPDGRWLALPLYVPTRGGGIETTVAVLDATTGTEVFRAPGSSRAPFETPLAWSPDGGWLVFASGTELRAWRAGRAESVELDVDLGRVRALAVR